MTRLTPRAIATHLQETRYRIAAASFPRRDLALDSPGLYAWWVDPAGAAHLSRSLGVAIGPGLIYAGQAGGISGTRSSRSTLAKRVYRNHIRGSIRGSTFRWTLAALLHRRLELQSRDGRRMAPESEARLSEWITAHLAVSWFACSDASRVLPLESDVLAILDPPLNLEGMPATEVRWRLRRPRSEFTRSGPGAESVRALRMGGSGTLVGDQEPAPTPDELAEQLGFPDGKQVRGFLRKHFPRSPAASGIRWGPLPPDMAAAVREWADQRVPRTR